MIYQFAVRFLVTLINFAAGKVDRVHFFPFDFRYHDSYVPDSSVVAPNSMKIHIISFK